MSQSLLHIVRCYGPVGGMERYVWELTGELADMGHKVEVLCERLHADVPPQGVRCIEFGELAPKPRWLSHLRFSHLVSRWVAANPDPSRIIHSHERTSVHHVTTFHGPPFALVLDRSWLRRISLRVLANLWLEKREVCGAQVKSVVPNSSAIAAMLQHYYPCIGERLYDPIAPGVNPGPARPERLVPKDGGIIGFVGKEWRRKGLDIAVSAIEALRKLRPEVELWVAGPLPKDIQHLFAGWHDGYRLLGEVDSREVYPELDLLLHPARAEPYGMVITEAMAANVPVLASDQCGAASEIGQSHGDILRIDEPSSAWADAAHALLTRNNPPPGFERPWSQVARDYAELYVSTASDLS